MARVDIELTIPQDSYKDLQGALRAVEFGVNDAARLWLSFHWRPLRADGLCDVGLTMSVPTHEELDIMLDFVDKLVRRLDPSLLDT
jgi:hypothetical protein